jgi:hypothetical protein
MHKVYHEILQYYKTISLNKYNTMSCFSFDSKKVKKEIYTCISIVKQKYLYEQIYDHIFLNRPVNIQDTYYIDSF